MIVKMGFARASALVSGDPCPFFFSADSVERNACLDDKSVANISLQAPRLRAVSGLLQDLQM